jgi:hypothetical protein
VSGGIDPTYLALTPKTSGPQGFINPLWLDNSDFLRSEKIYISQGTTGGLTNPILKMENTNSAGSTGGSVAMEVYKNKPSGATAGDVLFNQSVYGNDSALNKQEYTRISHTIRDSATSGEDGSIEFGCFVAGSFANFLQINGLENEINFTKPLDMVGNNIRSSTGSMTITTVASTGLGNITAIARGDVSVGATGSGSVSLTATGSGSVSLTSGTGGGAVNISGLAVNLTSNGTAGDKTTLTSATTIDLVPTTAIRTDSNITNTSVGGNKIDFAGGSADLLFDINKEKVRLHWNDASAETATILIDNQYDTTSNIAMTFTTTTGDVTTKIDNIATSQSVFLNDTRTGENKSITLDNNPNSNENRIDMVKNAGGGIVAQSKISNQTNSQLLFLTQTASGGATNKTIQLSNTTAGSLIYDNTEDNNGLTITSTNTNITLQTTSITSGQGDIIIAPSQNGSANGQLIFTGASLQDTTSTGSSGQYLKIVLNGTTYKIPLDNN